MISSELKSQHLTKYLVQECLSYYDRLPGSYHINKLRFEIWDKVIWTSYGFISYQKYAEFIKYYTYCYAYQRPVEEKGQDLYIVEGSQRDSYVVHNSECNCMLFRQRKNRWKEYPELFRFFLKPFCHHTLAVSLYKDKNFSYLDL